MRTESTACNIKLLVSRNYHFLAYNLHPFPPKTSWGKLGCTLCMRKRTPYESGNLGGGGGSIGAAAALIAAALGAMVINTSITPSLSPFAPLLPSFWTWEEPAFPTACWIRTAVEVGPWIDSVHQIQPSTQPWTQHIVPEPVSSPSQDCAGPQSQCAGLDPKTASQIGAYYVAC